VAALSDNLLIVMILAYFVAMLLHAAEYAFGQRGVVARAIAAPSLAASDRELVTVGGPGVLAEADSVVDLPADSPVASAVDSPYAAPVPASVVSPAVG
jgi:hypothetical protein